MVEETVTVSTVYIEPKAAQPTQDSTKDFTPRVDTATVEEKVRDSLPRKPFRTEVTVTCCRYNIVFTLSTQRINYAYICTFETLKEYYTINNMQKTTFVYFA